MWNILLECRICEFLFNILNFAKMTEIGIFGAFIQGGASFWVVKQFAHFGARHRHDIHKQLECICTAHFGARHSLACICVMYILYDINVKYFWSGHCFTLPHPRAAPTKKLLAVLLVSQRGYYRSWMDVMISPQWVSRVKRFKARIIPVPKNLILTPATSIWKLQ